MVRVTMGNVREGLEERGSWWGMKRMVGESFFSTAWVVVASVVGQMQEARKRWAKRGGQIARQ